MPGPRGALSVRIDDGREDRHVTRHVRGLAFTKVAPGGHQDLTFEMNLPRGLFNDLGPQDGAWVYDTRTGRTIFGKAYLENPTPVDGPRGQSYAIRAAGGMALASDESRALIYVDRNMGEFEQTPDATGLAGQFDVSKWYLDASYDRVRVAFDGGNPVGPGAFTAAGNYAYERAGMNIGGIRIGTLINGKNDANWANDLVTNSVIVVTGPLGTAAGVSIGYYAGEGFPSGDRRFAFRLRRTGAATNVADAQTYGDWADYSSVGQRVDRYGNLLVGQAGLRSLTDVYAHEVVEDLLGRMLRFCDPATAVIDTVSWLINQLAFLDGVKAATVLTELENWEPDYFWEIGETQPSGLHRFGYRAWPTTPRYVISVKDGWVQSGSDADLCNRILVAWTDATGKKQTTEVTAAGLGLLGQGLPVDDLGDRVKDADPVTLPDGFGSQANALRIGEALLRDSISPPTAGQIVVRRPVINQDNGDREMPWEIEPGCLVRVREIGNDLRCTQAAYSDDNTSMTLTLGRPVRTREQRLARLDAA